jgi:hypothetical protein
MEGKTDDNIADAATADERRDGDGGGEGSSERSRKGKVRYMRYVPILCRCAPLERE